MAAVNEQLEETTEATTAGRDGAPMVLNTRPREKLLEWVAGKANRL